MWIKLPLGVNGRVKRDNGEPIAPLLHSNCAHLRGSYVLEIYIHLKKKGDQYGRDKEEKKEKVNCDKYTNTLNWSIEIKQRENWSSKREWWQVNRWRYEQT